MKRQIFSGLALIGVAVSMMQPVMASTGTITINGLITASTCYASVNGGPVSADAANGTIILPTVGQSAFSVAGGVAGRTSLIIKVSDAAGTGACSVPVVGASPGRVYAHFEPGPSVSASTGRLINTGVATGVATGVGLQLLNKDYRPVIVGAGGSSGSADTSVAQNSTVETSDQAFSVGLRHAVEYYREAASVTPGTVSSSVVFTLAYI